MDVRNNIEILLIEDNLAETRLIIEVFNEDGNTSNIFGVRDGLEAMDYLHKKGKYKECKKPSLIILDLNLPKKNGMEVLKEIKTNNKLRHIPIIVMASSREDTDILKSYENYASAYIIKSINFDEFKKHMRVFKDYWFNCVALPKKEY